MISSKWQYPHPVLADGHDDYTEGSFALIEETHATKENSFVFGFSYSLVCAGLEKYIADGKAKVVLFVSSSAARFRKRFTFQTGKCVIQAEIEKSALVKSVEFKAFIVADGDDNFSLVEHNMIYYKGTNFSLRKGDILAESASITIFLDDSELQKPLSSIFVIDKAQSICKEKVSLSFEEDKIRIVVAPEIYEKYDSLKKRHPAIRRNLSAVITLPALVDAVEIMRSEETQNYQDYRWFRALVKKLEQYEINIDETSLPSSVIANLIYGDIVFDALDVVQKLLDKIEEGEFQDFGGND